MPAVIAEGVLTVRPPSRDALGRFLDDFMTVEKPALDRWGIRIAGGWLRTTGTAQQVLQIYRFDSMQAMETSAVAMMTDPGLALVRNAFPWVDRADFRYERQLAVTSPMVRLSRLDEPRGDGPPKAFLEVRTRTRWGMKERSAAAQRRRIEAWEAAGLVRFAVAYDVEYGRFGETVAIGELLEGLSSLTVLEDAVDSDTRVELGEVLVEDDRQLLQGLPYSPFR